MSRYSYAGEFKNPATGYFVKEVDEHFEIWVRHDRAKDGSCEPDREHNPPKHFDEHEDAQEYIESVGEFFEQDHSEYCEENHYEIAQMERYEAFRNEY